MWQYRPGGNVYKRTDGSNRHRYDDTMKASERFDCNKTRVIVLACDVAGNLVDNLEEAL